MDIKGKRDKESKLQSDKQKICWQSEKYIDNQKNILTIRKIYWQSEKTYRNTEKLTGRKKERKKKYYRI